ncbi:MAG: DNA polymerase III subunit chi [Candidatus Anoxychlamydiales bacterium]|nr:DNA polymerase III subunit chi [Candidatus Anoxychlamydiales bacterium]
MISKNSNTKVIFFFVKDIKTKLLRIIQTSLKHFESKEKLLIKVQDEASLKYVDELLWKEPKESFLPHVISEKKNDDFIVLTKSQDNLNESYYLFNLCQDTIDLNASYRVIYDFDDHTNITKKENSKKRYQIYRKLNFDIIER